MVAGSALLVAPLPVLVYVRLKVPAATGRLVQQLSLPSGPHVFMPGPPGAQLGGSPPALGAPACAEPAPLAPAPLWLPALELPPAIELVPALELPPATEPL